MAYSSGMVRPLRIKSRYNMVITADITFRKRYPWANEVFEGYYVREAPPPLPLAPLFSGQIQGKIPQKKLHKDYTEKQFTQDYTEQ